MRFILPIFLFAALIFGNQKITNPKTGEELSLYNNSWAVIIGINKYEKTRKLNYAVQDANSIRSMLISEYLFPGSNIKMLTDDQASREAVEDDVRISNKLLLKVATNFKPSVSIEVINKYLSIKNKFENQSDPSSTKKNPIGFQINN